MRIGFLEDDLEQAEVMKVWMEDSGHTVSHFASSSAFIKTLKRDSFDLLVFDWLLPDISGIEVLKRIRASYDSPVPVIFVTQQDRESDIVEALGAGADDYMTKPVSRAELVARVEALGRRAAGFTQERETILDFEPYKFDTKAQTINVNGEALSLTQKEFELALFLFQNAWRIVSRAHILETVWGTSSAIATRTVDTHASRIRSKLNFSPEMGWQLSSIYQHGYRLEKLDT